MKLKVRKLARKSKPRWQCTQERSNNHRTTLDRPCEAVAHFKQVRTASRWLRMVREVLSGNPGGGGVVYTSGRGVLMSRKTSTKEGDSVGCSSAEKGFTANCKSY